MYYMFYNDTIFKNHSIIQEVDKKYPACVMDREIGNYFFKNIQIHDTRDKRLTFSGEENTGKLSICYDISKYDDPIFNKLNKNEFDKLFTIIEYIVLSKYKTVEDINEDLIENIDTSSIYVKNSLKFSQAPKVHAEIIHLNDEEKKYEIDLPVYIQFSVKFENELENTDFRIYLSREYFLKMYPLYTITNVIEPCDPTYLLDPDKATSIVDMLVKSNEFTMKSMSGPIKEEDHSGMYVYNTKFIINGTNQMLPFGIMYQGNVPSVLEIRKAIREKLLSYGYVDKEIWKNILPDLFVVATWYIIPFWDNYTIKSTGLIYPSIANVYKFSKLIPEFFPELEIEFIEERQEMITCGYNELFFTTIPDPLNEKYFSLRDIYPTYQYHLSQDGTAYNNMDENAKSFNQVFNNCVAVAVGETTSERVSVNKINDMTWFNFTNGEIEFNLLSKESFEEKIDK